MLNNYCFGNIMFAHIIYSKTVQYLRMALWLIENISVALYWAMATRPDTFRKVCHIATVGSLTDRMSCLSTVSAWRIRRSRAARLDHIRL